MSSSSHVDLEKAPPPPSSPRHPSDDHGTPLSTLKIPHSEPQQQLDDPTGQGEDPFESKLREFIFIATVCSGQLITQAQIGSTMLPLPLIGERLGTDDLGQWSWMAASYALTLGVFVLVGGRLGDIFGSKRIWLIGYFIMFAFNVGSGFCTSYIAFDVCRGFAGLGGALVVPNAVASLGRVYAPGRRRTLVFAILGSLSPAGFVLGGVFSAWMAQTIGAGWIFWFTAIVCALCFTAGLFALPRDPPVVKGYTLDYVGFMLSTAGLVLFNFAWNQGPVVGWEVPYVYVLMIVGILLMVALYFYERRLGPAALIPTAVLHKTAMLVYLCLLLGWSSFGIFLYFTIAFLRDIREFHHPLSIAAQLIPLMPGGVITAAVVVPWVIPRVDGHWIFATAMLSFLVGNVIMAVAPVRYSYWGQVFPATILVVFGPDLSFTTGQLIVSNSVEREMQGIAAGLVNLVVNYSMSIGLGMAGTVERYVKQGKADPELAGIRGAQYFACGLATLAFGVVVFFVRMPRSPPGSH